MISGGGVSLRGSYFRTRRPRLATGTGEVLFGCKWRTSMRSASPLAQRVRRSADQGYGQSTCGQSKIYVCWHKGHKVYALLSAVRALLL